MGNYLHELGLLFGVYGDSGIKMCGTDHAGSLSKSHSSMIFALANVAGHEEQDAKTFAEWGADSLKCMSVP